ncbi:RNA-dependent RNA polymerase [Wenzhou qinvirus-like virus 1]|uniref:RNA-dependent RNA polymerase n=1 Tax=Wenzhou qinvirus-like virus 1 TaxID=1923647 RepID=A0A1L3KL81_9VIRU|nr:RNA-dependent RNA polymerase [Wenzhou qinvirus-like virus 1]APG78079.1 RNA-dependent RNA polymerase [Wenzhou qinvirus-like virus 1]
MARVFQIPRYHDQTLRRMAYFLNTPGFDMTERILLFDQESAKEYRDCADDILAGMDGDLLDISDESDSVACAEFQHFCQELAYNGYSDEYLSYAKNVGLVIHEILGKAAHWYSDEGAMKRLVGAVATERLQFMVPGHIERSYSAAARMAHVCFQASAVGDKLGAGALRAAKAVQLSDPVKDTWFAAQWAWQAFRSARSEPGIQDAHEQLKDESVNAEAFCRRNCALKTDRLQQEQLIAVYYLQGISFLLIQNKDTGITEGYALDQSAVEQVCDCIVTLAGFQSYFRNYKLSGEHMSDTRAVNAVFYKYIEWIGKNMYLDPQSQVLAKHCKLCITIMTNEYHPHMEELETGWRERARDLRVLLSELPTLDGDAMSILTDARIDAREALDLVYCFHIIPSCDGRMTAVFNSTVRKLSDPNPVDEEEHARFIKYCRATLVTHAVSRHRHNAKLKLEEGYEVHDKRWYRNCMRGLADMPPEDEWGKARLDGQYHFTPRMEHEAYTCSDVTHIFADPSRYMGMPTDSRTERHDANELLYFLRHAPYLSTDRHPTEERRNINAGMGIDGNIAVIANKSENSKPGDAQRETLSANDVLRAWLSETDAQAIQAANLLSGPSIRASEPDMLRKVQKVKSATRAKTVIVSLDVKGWSPNMDREHAFRVFDVILESVTKHEGMAPDIRSAYRDLELLLSRRGVHRSAPLPNGMVQGWTATLDTLMHSLITAYCIRTAKDRGLIPPAASSTSMAMIDDAVIVVDLPDVVTDEERERLAAAFMSLVAETYRKLGFIVEPAKTVCSSRVATYLNRIYACGAEITVAGKTYAKIAAEHNLRFSGHLNRCKAIWASARGACSRGADPVATYVHAAYIFWIEISRVLTCNLMNDHVGALNAFYAPTYLGGYDCPTIIAMLTNEVADNLTKYTHTILSYARAVYAMRGSDPNAAEVTRKLVCTYKHVMGQQLQHIGGREFMANPFAVRVSGTQCPETVATTELRTKLVEITESPVFKSAFEAAALPRCSEMHADVIRSGRWDASLLACIHEYSPDAIIAPLLAKALHSEVLAPLLTWRERKAVQDRIRSASFFQIVHLFNRLPPYMTTADAVAILDESSLDHAIMLRQNFHQHNNFEIDNHTVPYPMAMVAHRPPGERHGVLFTVKVGHMKSIDTPFRGGDRRKYQNLYDGFTDGDIYYGSRSSSAYMAVAPEIRTKPPLERTAIRALALCAYLDERTGEGGLVFSYILAMWGIQPAHTPRTTLMRIRYGVAPKRLASIMASTTHTVSLLPNARGLVTLDPKPIHRYSDETHTLFDAMSLVNCVRASVLLDTLCNKQYDRDVKFKWSTSRPAPARDELIVLRDRDDTLRKIERILFANRNLTEVSTLFLHAIQNCGVSTPAPFLEAPEADDIEPGVMFYVPRGSAWGQIPVDVQADQVELGAIHLDVPRLRIERRIAPGYGADVMPRRHPPNLRGELEHILNLCGRFYGPLMVACKLVEREARPMRSSDMYTSAWSEAERVAQIEFNDPVTAYDNVARDMNRQGLKVPKGVVDSLFARIPLATRLAIEFRPANIVSAAMKKSAVMVLLWFGQGRATTSQVYAKFASSGPKTLGRAHRFAAIRRTKLVKPLHAKIFATSADLLEAPGAEDYDRMADSFIRTISAEVWDREVHPEIRISEDGSVPVIMNEYFRYDSCPVDYAIRHEIVTAVGQILDDYHAMHERMLITRVPVQTAHTELVAHVVEGAEEAAVTTVVDAAEEGAGAALTEVQKVIGMLYHMGAYVLARDVQARNTVTADAAERVRGFDLQTDDVKEAYEEFMAEHNDPGPDVDI